jgi:hypothetical protein
MSRSSCDRVVKLVRDNSAESAGKHVFAHERGPVADGLGDQFLHSTPIDLTEGQNLAIGDVSEA